MKKKMPDKRNSRRYAIKAPASITLGASDPMEYMFCLHEISCCGALLYSTVSVPQETDVTMRTKLPFHQKWFGRDEVEFMFRGKVVRADCDTGQLAIEFYDDFRINTSLPE